MTNEEYVAGLRAVADWYERNPNVPLPESEITIAGVTESREAAADVLRTCAPCRKDIAGDLFTIRKEIGPMTLKFLFWRNSVCERVVVATEEVPERVIPAEPERVEPAYTKEIVEWRCEPVLPHREREAA